MKNYLFLVFMLIAVFTNAQQIENANSKVILITLDGFRWQELFTGADKTLIDDENYVKHTEELKTTFWRETPKERRELLLPFVWNTLRNQGQIHGNRTLGSKMNLTNTHWFSYPGYNEILSGIADDERIYSNAKIPNPNYTVLELVNNTDKYKGKVAAFGSWDVFPFIVNEERSGVPVNAGFELAQGHSLTSNEKYLNKLQKVTPSPWSSVRLDVFTHHYAMEYMQKSHPDLVYIAYGETDDFAHDGDYEAYLKSANVTDGFIQEIWDFVQKDPYYKGNTTILITTDHGRGTQPIDTWRSHGKNIKGADQVWLMAIGKGVSSKGEVKEEEQFFTNQIAATVAHFLGVNVENKNRGKRLSVIKE